MTKTDFTQDALTVARDSLEKFNRRDFAGILEDGDGAIDYLETGTGRHITDPQEMVSLLESWVAALPDVKGTVLSAMRDGDRLCTEIQWEGTHTGPLVTPSGTIPASGNRISTRAAQLQTIRDGRVVDTVHYLDIMTMMTQIAGIPSPTESPEQSAPAHA
jgi:predicted ester cyclase